MYLALAVLVVGGGLLPGRTLSSSDLLWSHAPWSTSRPQGVAAGGSNPEQSDAAVFFQPFLRQNRAELPGMPLWNPLIAGGRPYLAAPQTGVLSPFNTPGYVLPFWFSLAVIAALKLWAAAMGTFLLARALGLRFGGALLSGLANGFSLAMVEWLPWGRTSVFALLPWLILVTLLVARRPEPLRMAGLACLVALVHLGGYPQAAVLSLVVSVLVFAGVIVTRGGTGPSVGRAVLAFSAALAAGTGLAALVVLPSTRFLVGSYDYDFRQAYGDVDLPDRYLLGAFLPDYWGRAPHTLAAFAETSALHRSFYVGAVSLMLAAVAVVARPSRGRLLLLTAGLASLGLAAGVGPLRGVWTSLPVLGGAHSDEMVVVFVLPLSLLAGLGLDDLSRGLRPGRRTVAGLVAALLVVLPVIWTAVAGSFSGTRLLSAVDLAWGALDPQSAGVEGTDQHLIRLAALFEWMLPAALGLALILLALRGWLRPTALVVLAVTLLAADLWHIGLGVNPWIPRSHAEQPSTGAIDYLRSRRPGRFVGLASALPPDAAMRFGIYDARGYDPPMDRRYATFWSSVISPVLPSSSLAVPPEPTPGALRALSLLSVSDLIQAPEAPVLHAAGLRVAYDGPDARVYANDNALPRAWVASRQTITADEPAPSRLVAPGLRPRREVLTSARLPSVALGGEGREVATGSAEITRYEPEDVEIHADTASPGVVVLADTYDPGWTASVDGRDADVHRVDYMLRGAVIPPGEHTVRFRYRPVDVRLGLILSIISAVAIAGAAGIGARGRMSTRRLKL